ncbi:MAG: PAS domain S-box protein [Ginsengibacter sp.]
MNKLLLRQLQKHLGKEVEIPANLTKLLSVISDSYDHFEKDRKLIERSIELSSKEMIELNSQLKKNAKDELEKAHKQLKTLLEDINEVLYSVDMVSHKLTQISAVCEKVYGYSAAEFLANNELWQKVVHPKDRERVEEQVQILSQGKQVLNQYRIIHRDQSVRWIENKIIPTLDEQGLLTRIDGVTSDISERKKAEKELERSFSILEATIESTADGILVVDFNGKIVRYNNKFVELWQIPQEILSSGDNERAIGFVLSQLTSAEEFISKINELNINLKEVSFDIIRFKDGKIIERYSQPQLINDKCVGRVWSFRDITERTKSEETTRLLSDMISNTSDAIIIRDPDTDKIIFWNEGSEKLYGYSQDEAVGFSKQELLRPLFPISLEIINRSFHEKGSWNGELIHTDKNGKQINVETSWTFRRNSAGNTAGILEINRNITEKKNAEDALIERESQLTLAAQMARLGYWEFDVLKDVFTFSDQFYAIFRTTAEKVGGYTMSSTRYAELFVHPEDKEVVANSIMEAINSDDSSFSYKNEHRFIYANGEIGWISVHFYIVKDDAGRTIKNFGVNQDITERKNAEDTLRISEINLELKNTQLEQKNIELEQFAYIASHDLQEPLRTTSSFVKLLQKRYHGSFDPKADKYFAYILEASERMKVLIKNLLDYSKIGNKKELEQVDCNNTLQNVLADVGIAISETGAQIKFEKLPVIKGYATELKQLFQNLVVNAIKFRKKDVPPVLDISAEKNNGYWQFAFKDNGIGIEEKYYEKIFVIFQRLHTRTEYDGSGIGLSHCKKIVELHKGKIWVESKLGEGSTFQFTIQADTLL